MNQEADSERRLMIRAVSWLGFTAFVAVAFFGPKVWRVMVAHGSMVKLKKQVRLSDMIDRRPRAQLLHTSDMSSASAATSISQSAASRFWNGPTDDLVLVSHRQMGIVGAGLKDINRPAEKLSLSQSATLATTGLGAIFSSDCAGQLQSDEHELVCRRHGHLPAAADLAVRDGAEET
ncbi:hypothetical protein HDU81_005977 [Chytriomyces hyalinus]|nr:hypothetical protein HDU81_005977 [Chytriomyces hyalinus]